LVRNSGGAYFSDYNVYFDCIDLDCLFCVYWLKGKKMPKGKRKAPQKECPECKSLVHARVSFCRKCKHTFYIKKNVKRDLLAKNWRDLEAGDVIKVITGTGPYFVSKDREGERIMMGEKGKFEVSEIIDNGPKNCGIYAHQLYGRENRSHYREWIYMGESYCTDCNIHKEAHRIKVIKKKSQEK